MSVSIDKEKEEEINERIRRIREKNEEIKRRHMEVEADKQNADIFSSTAPPSATKAKPVLIAKPIRERPAPRPRPVERTSPRASDHLTSGKIYSNFAEGEGPPPDPGYSFLADDERDAPRVEVKSNATNSKDSEKSAKKSTREKSTAKSGGKSRGRRNEQRSQRSSQKSQSGGGGKSAAGDDKWRAERAVIDEARIQRQRTAEGNWRREWDNEKADEEDIDLRSGIATQTFGRRGPPRSPPKQWRETKGFHGRGQGESSGHTDERQPNGNMTNMKSHRGNPRLSTDLLEDAQHKPPANQTHNISAPLENKPLFEERIGGKGKEMSSYNHGKSEFSPRQVTNDGEQIRILLRSKSNEYEKVEPVRRNAPERRSFGSGRISHHKFETDQSFDDAKVAFENMSLRSPAPRFESQHRSSEIEFSHKLHSEQQPARSFHSLKSENSQEPNSTSLPQRVAASVRKQHHSKSELPISKEGVDEGEESWEDFSDNDHT